MSRGLPPSAMHLLDTEGHALRRCVTDGDPQLPEAA